MDKADLQREKASAKIRAFMLEKIKEHEDTYDENNIRDFVDLYIQSSRENKDETKETFTSTYFKYFYRLLMADNNKTLESPAVDKYRTGMRMRQ